MPNEEGRHNDDPKMTIKALAWYLHRGYPLKVYEPPVRGTKGPSRDSRRDISSTPGPLERLIQTEAATCAGRTREPVD
jgi:hypothetical protein